MPTNEQNLVSASFAEKICDQSLLLLSRDTGSPDEEEKVTLYWISESVTWKPEGRPYKFKMQFVVRVDLPLPYPVIFGRYTTWGMPAAFPDPLDGAVRAGKLKSRDSWKDKIVKRAMWASCDTPKLNLPHRHLATKETSALASKVVRVPTYDLNDSESPVTLSAQSGTEQRLPVTLKVQTGHCDTRTIPEMEDPLPLVERKLEDLIFNDTGATGLNTTSTAVKPLLENVAQRQVPIKVKLANSPQVDSVASDLDSRENITLSTDSGSAQNILPSPVTSTEGDSHKWSSKTIQRGKVKASPEPGSIALEVLQESPNATATARNTTEAGSEVSQRDSGKPEEDRSEVDSLNQSRDAHTALLRPAGSPTATSKDLNGVEAPGKHGKITSYAVKTFLDTEPKVPLEDSNIERGDRTVANNHTKQCPNTKKHRARRDRPPKIGSVKRVETGPSEELDLTPAPNAKDYWIWDEVVKSYYHVDSDTRSVFWYEDTDSE
jgi:hypothetical protein